MVVIAPVFDGEDGVDDVRRQRGNRHWAALGAVDLDRAEQRRIQREAIARIVAQLQQFNVVGRARRRRLAPRGALHGGCRFLERDTDGAALELCRPRRDRDVAFGDGELARLLRLLPACVADVVQAIDKLLFGERLSAPQFERPGEDAREHALPFTVQLLVNEPTVADVVVAADERQDDDGYGGDERGNAHPPAFPERQAAMRSACGGLARWRQSSDAPFRGAVPLPVDRRGPARTGSGTRRIRWCAPGRDRPGRPGPASG